MPMFEAAFHPKFAPLFDPQWSFVILRGGRAGMKSWAAARAALILGAQSRKRFLCGRELQNSLAESMHKLLSDQVELLGLSAFYQIQRDGIDGGNGTEFFFMGLHNDPQKVKSTEGVDIAIIEEAQSISEDSLTTLIPTILRKKGAQIWLIYNPRFETDPVHKLAENPPPGTIVIDVSYRDAMEMGCFDDKLIAVMEHDRLTNPRLHAHIWEGKIVPNLSDALWTWESIDNHRAKVGDDHDLNRVLVSIDPAVTANKNSDETGIVVVGSRKGQVRHYYVLSDVSGKFSPETWARRALQVADTFQADGIVYEVNQGGDLVTETLKNVCRTDGTLCPRLIPVRATRGKVLRAEPIAALYSQGVVHHVGNLPELENQMLQFDPQRSGQKSPDRVDALVHGITALATGRAPLQIAAETVARLTGQYYH